MADRSSDVYLACLWINQLLEAIRAPIISELKKMTKSGERFRRRRGVLGRRRDSTSTMSSLMIGVSE